MIMRGCWIMIPVLLTGCATHQRAHRPLPEEARPMAAIPARPETSLVETRYEIGGYYDAADPFVRHDPHAIYRATRVPVRPGGVIHELTTVPRESFPPASFAPLPASAEMGAELMMQKEITRELRAIHTAMNTTRKEAELKLGELVRQTAETLKLRQTLEEERARVRQLEVPPRDRNQEPEPTPPAVADLKW